MFKIFAYLIVILVLIYPTQVFASVIISEIMYAPNEGVAYEWFEIFNNGADEVNIEDWRFNDGSNHIFSKPPKNGGQGSLTIMSGSYVIIAKEADTFLSTNSSFTSTVIDGSFSLTDSGDILSLIDSDGVVVDSVSYDENAGAKKNELSLQLSDGVWAPSTPTPGTGSLSVSQSEQQEDNQESIQTPTTSSTQYLSNTNNFTVESQISVSAGQDRTVTVGADSLFKGIASGLLGNKLKNARYVWNFGDGTRKEGQNVLHYYRHTGKYVVTLEVSSGEYSATDRIAVSANEANISITSNSQNIITITNLDKNELNISWWLIAVGDSSFMLPKHTIILSQYEINLSSEITGLYPTNNNPVKLKYPNGEEVKSNTPQYIKPKFENTRARSSRSIIGSEIQAPSTRNAISTETNDVIQSISYTEIKNKSQIANVAEKTNTKYGNALVYWTALFGIVTLGIISVIILRHKSRKEITIIE